MDQTASADKIIFRHFRNRCQNANLDRYLGVCFGGYHEKAPEIGAEPLHNFTDFEHYSF